MPLPVYRLRRWLAVLAVMFSAVVAGMYLYARLRQHSVLKGFPGKISYDIKQTASGFQFSKSEAGRTIFTIRAKSVKEFKLNGRADLHDVSITLYGRDTSRFDQISGDDFSYDQKSGDITAKGEVQIDLEANPSGLSAPDQSAPHDLKNPVHLKTRDLVFNRESGDATTSARVDFRTPQATGWAVGVGYTAKTATLTLASQIHVQVSEREDETLFASHGVITRDPRQIVLDRPVMKRASGTLQAEQATFFLGAENEVQRILATGNVNAGATGKDDEPMRARADQAELLLVTKQNLLRSATLTGNVHVERQGAQPMQGDAGRAVLDFRGQNELEKVHAMDGVHLAQHGARGAAAGASAPQDSDIYASAIDFFVIDGRSLDRAETSGAAKISISPQPSSNPATAKPQTSVITAARFEAKFAPTPTGPSRLVSMHGAPDAKVVTLTPGVPDRVSTSQSLDATFLPQGGIATIVQQGSVAYSDNLPLQKRTQAWAAKAVYTPDDKILLLSGDPRVTDGGMTTTATSIRINRATGDAFAEGDVKSTYSDLKEETNGAWLASASPIHVTAASMTAHNSPAIALYQGDARLWQDANLIEAPSIQFDHAHRSLLAQGTPGQPVTTILVQQSEKGLTSEPPKNQAISENKANKKFQKRTAENIPITITAARLSYADLERKAHYQGSVFAQGPGFTASSNEMDVYFSSPAQTNDKKTLSNAGHVERMVAQGDVILHEPTRRAVGQTLIYTSSDDKFVLTGGPPSIFDAERGKITGVSLTFFRADDRVLVEGKASTPVVTQTRVTH
jgi:lipopolysaccharide export system protein LptA